MNLEFTRDELTEDPVERNLNVNKSIVVFNIKQSEKTSKLNTGNKFNYEHYTYEIMNRESVQSLENYVKFNCIRKI